MLPVVTIDFETLPIEQRPDYPPMPVGVSIRHPDGGGGYGAFGHPSKNNDTLERVVEELTYWFAEAEAGRVWLLFFNAKFDVQVACEKLGLPMPRWDAVHDAMYLAFLDNPHAANLDLKSLAHAMLDLPPDERDAINDWVIANIKELRKQYAPEKISITKGKVAHLWKWYARAPGDIVGAYANGDTHRTFGLFELLYQRILDAGMGEAYDRLRRVTPILMENERLGMRVDVPLLQDDVVRYSAAFLTVEDALRSYLGVPDLNLDADKDVAAALVAADAVDPETWVKTASGDLSVSKANLKPHHFRDPQLASALGYRNRLATTLKMFMRPWLEQALKTGGTIHTNWNITRGEGGGTRTGRPSTNNHNFLNLSKDFETKKDGYTHPDFLDLPSLPTVRSYVLPDAGCVMLHRDFKGQELRVFADFECGPLNAAYCENPMLDPHDEWVRPLMEAAAGREFEKTTIKVLNFQGIYGGGAPALAKALEISLDDAKALKVQHDAALPGRKALSDEIKNTFDAGLPIVTWGGRVYNCQPAGYSEKYKRWMTYQYKGINYIVQGSAADLTIESILDWHDDPRRDPRSRLMVQVYDEIDLSVPSDVSHEQMRVLKENMEKDRLSVPMRSDGKWGPTWGALKKYDDEAQT